MAESYSAGDARRWSMKPRRPHLGHGPRARSAAGAPSVPVPEGDGKSGLPLAGDFGEPVLHHRDTGHRAVRIGGAPSGDEPLAVGERDVAERQVDGDRIALEDFARLAERERAAGGFDLDFHQDVAVGAEPQLVTAGAPARLAAASQRY